MAVTKAREDVKYNPTTGEAEVHPSKGASGGVAAEGYNMVSAGHGVLGGVENAKVTNEGVTQRGAKGDHERFVEANKFMESKKKAGELEAKAAADLAAGKTPEKSAFAKEQEKAQEAQQKEADKKPTAPGVDINQLNNPAAVQSAKETEKAEAKAVVDANKSVVDQAKEKKDK